MKKLVTAPHGLHGSLTVPGDEHLTSGGHAWFNQ